MKRKVALITIIAILLTMLTACAKSEKQLSVTELLDLGEKYLLEMNYEQAVVQFLKVIEIEPKNPRGYTGAAEAYVGLGQIDKAVALLGQGQEQLPDDITIKEMISKLRWDSFTPEQKAMLDRLEVATNDFDHQTAFEIMSSSDFLALYTQLEIDRAEGGAGYKKSDNIYYLSFWEDDDEKDYFWHWMDPNGMEIECQFWLSDWKSIAIRHMNKTDEWIADGEYTMVHWTPENNSLWRYEGIAADNLIHGTEVQTDLITGERYILNWDHGRCTNYLVDDEGNEYVLSESGDSETWVPEPDDAMQASTMH